MVFLRVRSDDPTSRVTTRVDQHKIHTGRGACRGAIRVTLCTMSISRRHLLGGIAATAVLSACGSNSGGVDNGSANASSRTGTAKLTQWYHEYGEKGVRDAVQRYAADYKKSEVSVKWNPGDAYMKLLSTTLLSGSGVPDVFESENGATLDMIQQGQVTDLTELIGDDKDKFSSRVLDRMTLDGKIYALSLIHI